MFIKFKEIIIKYNNLKEFISFSYFSKNGLLLIVGIKEKAGNINYLKLIDYANLVY